MRPLVVMSKDSLDQALGVIGQSFDPPDEQLWIEGDPEEIDAALQRETVFTYGSNSTEIVLDTPSLQSLRWTLGLLSGLGLAAGVISLVGLLLYLQARHKERVVAAALTRRMGLGRPEEGGAWMVEIAGAMLVAFAAAVGAGLAGSLATHERLDLRPTLSPEPILVVPLALLALMAVLLVVASGGFVWLLRRQSERANVAEALRT